MYSLIFLFACLIQYCYAATNCPLMGPTFPKPQLLSQSAILKSVFQNLTALFEQLDAGNSTGAATNSYSLQLFSVNESKPLFQHYHTATNLAELNSTGVKKVDADTVYRMGSLTKVFTVYTFLVEAGDIHFNDPVTKFVPELAAIAVNSSGDAITKVAWSDITIGELASHMAGIATDNSLMGELTQTLGNIAVAIGFPPLNDSEIPTCGVNPLCSRKEFFAGFAHLYPSFATAETPAYSNVAFQILAYALESITGRSFKSSLEEKVLKPLNMKHTYYSIPPESVGVLPGSPGATQWSFDLGEEIPAGGLFSSIADMATLGRSIIASSLLSPAQTRRWLKPATLTSDLRETIGYPWGIRRITLNADHPYSIKSAYNKAGRIGSYSALLALLPEYGVGFAVMVAGDLKLSNWALAEILGTNIVPALEQAAREEAQILFAGRYSSASINSSLTLSTDPTKPGIGVDSWISNGTDMIVIANELQTNAISTSYSMRLYPTELQTTAADGSKQVVMKATWEDLAAQLQDGMFVAACGTWIGPTAFVYGAMAMDQFVFSIDASGKVVSVQPLALRVSLKKG